MEYENMSLTELKEIAKEKEIKNISKLKKEELIEVLKQTQETTISSNKNEVNLPKI